MAGLWRDPMSNAITELQPTQFSFTVRFVQGYRFLDRCGEALVRLEDTLDEGWIPGETVPTGGQLRNFTLGMGAKFHSESLTVVQTEFLSFEHFQDQTSRIFEVLRGTFDIRRIFAPVLRVICQVGFPGSEAGEGFLRGLDLCTPNRDLTSELGGSEAAFNFTLCTHQDMNWSDHQVQRRRRIDARVIRQERQPYFDERIMQRLPLLPERYREAMRALRKLRRQHAQIVDFAVQFDMEDAFETEFNSRTFDLASFLAESRRWTERIEGFIKSRYRTD